MPARSRSRLALLGASLVCGLLLSASPGPDRGTAAAADAGAVVVPFGDARAPEASATATSTAGRRIVAMATTRDGGGYWLAARDGGVFAFGTSVAHSPPEPQRLNQPIVGMASAPAGTGYWLVARDGGVFAFGPAARFHGSAGDITLNQPVAGMAATPDGNGYWLVARDGGIFTFGTARYHGSTGDITLNQPIVGMAATPDGNGYWLVARDGGIFTFGTAGYHGSAAGDGGLGAGRVATALTSTVTGRGYAVLAVPGSARVAFGGDVHGVDRVAAFMERGGDPLAHVRPAIAAHDATIVNLETNVGTTGQPQRKQYTFQSPPVLVQRLKAGGVDVVSLANNHSLDFGRGALLETIAHSRDAGLLVVGAGANRAEAYRPAVVSTAGGDVAFVGLSQVVPAGWAATADTPGVASAYDLRAATDAVRSARRQADHVVVLVHAGTEGSECPSGPQRSLATALVDAGADVVAGAHPHVLQGIATARSGTAVIAYSLGNFVWYSGNPATGLLSVDLGADGVARHDFLPARIDNTGSPVLLSGNDAAQVRAHVASLTPGVGRC